MSHIQSLWFVMSFVLLHSVLGKEICDFKDVDCLTRGAKNVYKSIVAGTKTKTIDPLYADKINGYIGALKYEITNSTLSGLRNCEVVLLNLNSETTSYEYHLHCPELIFDYYYTAKGDLATTSLDGRGAALIIIDDYLLILKGSYSKLISGKDQKIHVTVNNNNLYTDLKGRLTFRSKCLISGDKEKFDLASAYFNDNYKVTEENFRSNILQTFLAIFAKEINMYLKTVPLDEVIPKY